MIWLNKRKIDLKNIFSKTGYFYKTHLLFYYCFKKILKSESHQAID